MIDKLEKYKVCPVCKTKNSPTVLECVECGNDLMGVRVVDDSYYAEPEKAPQKQTPQSATGELVRICDCGQENDVSARKCVSCGEDISDIVPSPRVNAVEATTYCISSIDGEAVLRLECPSEHVIGRENELSGYLESKPFVSRKHARLTVTSEGLFLQNLSRANGTYVNNEKIDDNTAYKLCVGDEIGLGGIVSQNGRQERAAYFTVGIE